MSFRSSLEELLATNAVLIADGAMGTELFARGLEPGGAPELMNVETPEKVTDVHRAYIAAGSDIVLTNSFGGTSFRLALHDAQDRVVELNAAAARNARAAAEEVAAERVVLVAGSMGPTGELLEPMGSMTSADAVEAFAQQARGLAEGGADLLWIETMSDLDEVACAIEGARQATDLPVTVTLSFDTAGRTMMGVTGAAAVERLAPLGVAGVGANCGNNLYDTEAVVAEMATVPVEAPVVLIAKANAGIPVWAGDELSYDGSPDVMAAYADRMRRTGARIIGGCCGTGPDHIAAIRATVDGTAPVPDVEPPTPPNRGGVDGESGGGGSRAGRRRRRH